jgi:hypothetical protein
MIAADYNDNNSGSTEYIPLSTFGGPKAEQTLKRVGIEAVIIEHRSPPFIQIVRRYPVDNPLASFLNVHLDDKEDMGIDGIFCMTVTGPTRLKLLIDELLQEKITGGDFGRPCSNGNCLMPIIQEGTRGEVFPLSQKIRKTASDVLVKGIRKWLLIEDIGNHR